MRRIPQWVWLAVVLFFALATRLYRVQYPPTYVFDEVYHAVTAKLIAKNDPRAYEWWHPSPEPNTAIDWLHPPYAKYTQAFSIVLFGENTTGWRMSSVIFGVGVIGAVFLLTHLAFKRYSLSVLAAGIAALDGLLLVQSRVAMNDIHVTFFILTTLICYLWYRAHPKPKYLLYTGISAGLAMGTKWSGVYILGAVGLVEMVEYIKFVWRHRLSSPSLKKTALLVVSLLIIPALMYVLAYSHMFMQGKGFDHLKKLHEQIWWYQTNLTATHDYQSRPWQWFLDLRPVWYHVDYFDNGTIANMYAFGNPVLFWYGGLAVVFSALYLIGTRITSRLSKQELNLLIILFAYGMVWLPWMFSPRIMFFYHYAPAVPLLCIILAYWLWRLWHLKVSQLFRWNKMLVLFAIFTMTIAFGLWYPQWTAIPVSRVFADDFYFQLKQWK